MYSTHLLHGEWEVGGQDRKPPGFPPNQKKKNTQRGTWPRYADVDDWNTVFDGPALGVRWTGSELESR